MKKNLFAIPGWLVILYWIFTLTQRNTVIPFVQELFNVKEVSAVFIVVASLITSAYLSLPLLAISVRLEREEKALKRKKD